LDFCHAAVFVFLSSTASVLSQIFGHGIRRISPGLRNPAADFTQAVSVRVQDIFTSASGDLFSSLPFIDFDFPIACGLLQGENWSCS
jgi:hypothetical protein